MEVVCCEPNAHWQTTATSTTLTARIYQRIKKDNINNARTSSNSCDRIITSSGNYFSLTTPPIKEKNNVSTNQTRSHLCVTVSRSCRQHIGGRLGAPLNLHAGFTIHETAVCCISEPSVLSVRWMSTPTRSAHTPTLPLCSSHFENLCNGLAWQPLRYGCTW